jgi:urease accessory protein
MDREAERTKMRVLLSLLLIALPTAAFAHTGHGDTSGLVHGFMHPIGGLDHVLAMVAVGVFAFVLGGRALFLVPLSFVGMMAVGFLLGATGIDVPFVELGIALSSVVIGGVAALGRPMPIVGAMSLVGVFAVFHGHAHGVEMPADAGGLEYAAGFMVATALLHAAGIGGAVLVARLMGKYGRTAAQVAGGAFALGGIGILAGWL